MGKKTNVSFLGDCCSMEVSRKIWMWFSALTLLFENGSSPRMRCHFKMASNPEMHFCTVMSHFLLRISSSCQFLSMESVEYAVLQTALFRYWYNIKVFFKKFKVDGIKLKQVVTFLKTLWWIKMFFTCIFLHRLFGTETKDKLPLADFLSAVGQLKFRGTSVLFRLPHSCTLSLKR